MSGKGSAPRPFNVSNDEYANRWDAIFGRDLPKENTVYVCMECGGEGLKPLCMGPARTTPGG